MSDLLAAIEEKLRRKRSKLGLGEGEVMPEGQVTRPDLGIDQKRAADFMRGFRGETEEDPRKQTRWQKIKSMMGGKPVAMK